MLLSGDIKNPLYAALVWWSTKIYAGSNSKEAMRGDEACDQEEVGGAGKEDDIHQGAPQTVQLLKCEANDLFLLTGDCAQSTGAQDTRIYSSSAL